MSEEKKMQPIMLDAIADAEMAFGKISEILTALNKGLTAEQKVELASGFEGLAYTSMVILMDAQYEVGPKDEDREVE